MDVVLSNRPVDVGLFGTIVEAEWHGTHCAAKMLSEEDAKKSYLSESFINELTLWNELKHPNILQFFGIFFPKTLSHPVIVTELQHHNLAKVIKERGAAIPIQIKASILVDVALALRYLHSLPKPIILRDLSASCVYLTKEFTAKLGDFGNAIQLNHSVTTRPGSMGNLPKSLPENPWPERYSSVYSDAFCYGDLILHVLLNDFPMPDSKLSSTGRDKFEIKTEYQRRRRYLQSLQNQEKQYLPVIERCLDNHPDNRPKFKDLTASLGIIKAQIESVQLPNETKISKRPPTITPRTGTHSSSRMLQSTNSNPPVAKERPSKQQSDINDRSYEIMFGAERSDKLTASEENGYVTAPKLNAVSLSAYQSSH